MNSLGAGTGSIFARHTGLRSIWISVGLLMTVFWMMQSEYRYLKGKEVKGIGMLKK